MNPWLRLLTLAAVLGTVTTSTLAAEPHGTRINFSATVDRRVPNDLGNASAYIEMGGNDSAELAQRVNAAMADALAMAKSDSRVTVKTGGSSTWPVYANKAKGGQTPAIEGWRMRSELQLESRDAAALGALVARLQGTMAVSQIGFSPAPDTRRKVEDDAALDAIRIFRDKAARYAAALKRGYKIRTLTINGGGHVAPRAMRAMAATAESMPVEAGESAIQVSVDGQIELIESK